MGTAWFSKVLMSWLESKREGEEDVDKASHNPLRGRMSYLLKALLLLTLGVKAFNRLWGVCVGGMCDIYCRSLII